MAFTAGTRLGPCEVLGLIRADETAESYEPRDTRLDRAVTSVPTSEIRERASKQMSLPVWRV